MKTITNEQIQQSFKDWDEGKENHQPKEHGFLKLITEKGVHRLISPGGYKIGHLTRTMVSQDVEESWKNIAFCLFEGFHKPYREKNKNFIVSEKKAPTIKRKKMYSPSGEKLDVKLIKVVEPNKGDNELCYYEAAAYVSLEYDTKHYED